MGSPCSQSGRRYAAVNLYRPVEWRAAAFALDFPGGVRAFEQVVAFALVRPSLFDPLIYRKGERRLSRALQPIVDAVTGSDDVSGRVHNEPAAPVAPFEWPEPVRTVMDEAGPLHREI